MSDASENRGLYTMTVACQLSGLSPRTLRLYEEEGLILPSRRSEGGQRLYSNQDIAWIRCIRELVHEHGLTTIAIRRLLDLIPCWELKRCSNEQAKICAPALNIPNMATGQDSGKEAIGEEQAETEAASAAEQAETEAASAAEQKPLEFILFYGVAEFGAVFSCARCIQAERTIRKLAAKLGLSVEVHKYDILSPEADQYGIILTPTIILNKQIISSGKALSDAKLEQLLRTHAGHAQA
jgi:MerR family transcriptional regulator/heat shock protein HspR